MPPPNITYSTAITIPSLPFSLTTSASDAGITYDLWYKYTPTNWEVISVFGYGTYRPFTILYRSVDGVPSDFPGDVQTPSGVNVPVTVSVEAGEICFIKFDRNGASGSTADLTIDIIAHSPQSYPDGSLMINDDTYGFSGAILSPTTGNVLKFIENFPAGEEGDSLTVSEGGQVLVENYNDDSVKLYDKHLTLITSIPVEHTPITGSMGDIIALHTSNPKFYIGLKGTGSNPARFATISIAGIINSWTFLPVAGLTSIAVNSNETILYITGQSTSMGFVKRWDLVNNVFLSDFPHPAGLSLVYVLKNDNVVISTMDTVAHIATIKEYNNAGTLLHTYTFTNKGSVRIKHAIDNPVSIWSWFEEYSSGISTFINLRLSDGVHLQEFSKVQFESGVYQGDETPTPTDRFGHSFSCPIFVLYEGGPANGNGGGNGGGNGEPPPSGSAMLAQLPVEVLGLLYGPTGIYFINPDKATWHDSYYNDIEKKIPNPTIRTALLGE